MNSEILAFQIIFRLASVGTDFVTQKNEWLPAIIINFWLWYNRYYSYFAGAARLLYLFCFMQGTCKYAREYMCRLSLNENLEQSRSDIMEKTEKAVPPKIRGLG